MTQKLSHDIIKKQKTHSNNLYDLPKNWEISKLEDICLIIMGLSPPSSTYNKEKNGIPFFQGKTDFGVIYPTPRVWCDSPKKIAKKDDILISVRAPVGPTNLSSEKCCIGRGLAAVRPEDKINPRFILYLLRSIEDNISRKGTGTTFKAITAKQLKELQVLVPPIQEQQRIISKLQVCFLALDECEKSLHSNSQRLENFKHSLLNSVFVGKLTKKWRQDNKNNLELASKFLSEEKKIGIKKSNGDNLPPEWEIAKIESVCSEIIGGGTPSRQVSEYYGGQIIWLTPSQTTAEKILTVSDSLEKITEKGLRKSSAKIIPKGAVLLTSRATIGNVALAGCNVTTNQGFASFVCSKAIKNQYLAYWLWANKDLLHHRAKGTTFKEISKSKLKQLDIPLPSLSEQHHIVSILNDFISKYHENRENLRTINHQLKLNRKSLLRYAFRGNLVPQDPNEEPAEILLKRIKENRKFEK